MDSDLLKGWEMDLVTGWEMLMVRDSVKEMGLAKETDSGSVTDLMTVTEKQLGLESEAAACLPSKEGYLTFASTH